MLAVVALGLGGAIEGIDGSGVSTAGGVMVAAFGIAVLAGIVPAWAVSVRRVHDIGWSGW